VVASLVAGVMLVTSPSTLSAVAPNPTQSSCRTFTGKVSFSPGLPPATSSSVVPAVVKISGDVAGCVDGGVTSGTVTGVAKFAQPLSCRSLAEGVGSTAKGSETINWSNGKHSTMSLVIDTVPANTTQLTLSGDVGSGLFAHSGEEGSISLKLPAGSCTSEALAVASFTGGLSLGPVGPPPSFTTPNVADFTEGTAGSFTISTKATSRTYFRWTGALPAGLVLFNDGNGRTLDLEGIPSVGTAGSYRVTIGAVDAKRGVALQTVTINIAPIAAGVPVVTGVSPSAATVTPDTDVAISGSGFTGATAVNFGSTPSTSISVTDGGDTIDALVPPGVNAMVDVSVVGSAGTSPISVDDEFTYQAAPQRPIILHVVPVSLGISVQWSPLASSDEDTSVTLTGSVAPGFPGSVPNGCATVGPQSFPVAATALAPTVTFVTSAACRGVPYTVTAVANNQWGASAASLPSRPAVPLPTLAPSPPLILQAFPRSGAVLVEWGQADTVRRRSPHLLRRHGLAREGSRRNGASHVRRRHQPSRHRSQEWPSLRHHGRRDVERGNLRSLVSATDRDAVLVSATERPDRAPGRRFGHRLTERQLAGAARRRFAARLQLQVELRRHRLEGHEVHHSSLQGDELRPQGS